MKKLTFVFPDTKTRNDFVAWFLDGGGEYAFNDGNENANEPTVAFDPPGGAEKWDWQTKGDDADEHVIECSLNDV